MMKSMLDLVGLMQMIVGMVGMVLSSSGSVGCWIAWSWWFLCGFHIRQVVFPLFTADLCEMNNFICTIQIIMCISVFYQWNWILEIKPIIFFFLQNKLDEGNLDPKK